MTKITAAKLERANWRVGRRWGYNLTKSGKLTKALIAVQRILGYKEAKPRFYITNPSGNGMQVLVSEGQRINWKKA